MTSGNTEAANQPIELTDDDLEQVTGGAMMVARPTVPTTMLREDPCAGGQIMAKAR